MGFMLNELEESNFHNVDWKLKFVNIRNLLNTNALALRRIILYASSCVMVNKSMAREIVLPRFVGKDQLVDALRHSDFGTPDLFGPLNAEMEENVRMYRTHNNKEWRICLQARVTSNLQYIQQKSPFIFSFILSDIKLNNIHCFVYPSAE